MRFAGCVAAALSIAAFGAVPGYAADFGGDCCSELEERIAELEATTARKGNRKVSLTIYGEVNQALLYWDDGTEENVYVVTNQTTKNLLGFEGRAQVTPEVSAGYRIEVDVRTSPSDFVDQGGTAVALVVNPIPILGDDGLGGIVVRHSNWWMEHRSIGRVTVGQGSNATDGIAEIDLSGSTAVSVSSVETWNEGFLLKDKNTGQQVIPLAATGYGIIVDLFRGNLDGGRGNVVLYESPVLGGFKFSAAWGEDDDWDVALRYFTEFSGFQVAAGIGYHEGKITDTDNFARLFGDENALRDHEEWTGSASVLHVPSGIFVTVAGGSREWPDSGLIGESFAYGKAGIFQKWSALGKTSLYGEYYHIWDVGAKEGAVVAIEHPVAGLPTFVPFVCDARCNEEASAWGVGVVQHIDAAAMEVYLAYRHYWADDVTSGLTLTNGFATVNDHDIEFDTVMTGARIKF